MLDAMLTAGGHRTGLYTSPHLVRPNERIRIAGDGHQRPRSCTACSIRIREACERGLADGSLAAHPSFFEVMTAAALCAFQSAKVDTAVLEVGLGGRLDATNAVEPLVSAIVTVDLDHVGTLGSTLEAIAREKAGIARSGRTLVSGVTHPGAAAVIREHCDGDRRQIPRRSRSAELPTGARLGLEGAHQRHNARVARVAFEELARAVGRPAEPRAIERGPRDGPLGRSLAAHPGVAVDSPRRRTQPCVRRGARRAPGVEDGTQAGSAVRRDGRQGHSRHSRSAGAVRRVGRRDPASRASGGRKPTTSPHAARALGLPADAESETGAALEKARALAGPGGVVLVAGSLYLVGAVLSALEGAGAPGPVSM